MRHTLSALKATSQLSVTLATVGVEDSRLQRYVEYAGSCCARSAWYSLPHFFVADGAMTRPYRSVMCSAVMLNVFSAKAGMRGYVAISQS